MKTEFFDYYNRGREKDRHNRCFIEFTRTKDILDRNMDANKKDVLDMGGGAGFYSFWLAGKGYNAHLRDIVPLHIEQAKQEEIESNIKLASIAVGDAACFEFEDNSFDYILLFGPMYHIQGYEDRIKVLSEAKRTLKDDGKIFAVFIHRNSALLDFVKLKDINDDKFKESAIESLESGYFNNRDLGHFTNGYFHTAEEFKNEVIVSGLKCKNIYNIEGINRIIDNFDEKIKDKNYLDFYMNIMRIIEQDSSLHGVASHLMTVLEK